MPNRPLPKVQSRDRLAEINAKIRTLKIMELREQCQDDLRFFVEHAWPHIDAAPFQSNWMIDALCDHLEAVMLGYIPRLLINVPPRCSKTTIVSIMFPAWIWLRYHDIAPLSGPQVSFLVASYNDRLTMEASNKFRRLVKGEWYQQLWGVQKLAGERIPTPLLFMKDQDTKSRMDNNRRGTRQSTSVGGGLLGLGGDILIGDDLNNTETERIIETGADRQRAITFWNEMRSTRRNNQNDGYSAVINVQQRVHQDDVSGSWRENEDDLVHLMIPMRHDPMRHCVTVRLPQYEDDDPPWEDPRDPSGEDLMWPEYFSEKVVVHDERALGPIMAAGRLQQSPRAKGGNIILQDYWRLWGAQEASRYNLQWDGERREFPQMQLIVGSLDTAQKEKEENDFNALTIWGVWLDRNRNKRAMMMYGWQDRRPLNWVEVFIQKGEAPAAFEKRRERAWGVVQMVAFLCRKYHVNRLLIEDKTRGHDVAAEIRRQYVRENWGVQLVNPVQDKVSRAHTCVPLFADNCIWAPETRWSQIIIEQCENFPKGTHDDYVDSVTQFVNWARENGILTLVDEATAYEEEQATFKGTAGQKSIAGLYGV